MSFKLRQNAQEFLKTQRQVYAYLLQILNNKGVKHEPKFDDNFVGELLYHTNILDLILDHLEEQPAPKEGATVTKFNLSYYSGEKMNDNEKIAQKLSALNVQELFANKLPAEITDDTYAQLIEAFNVLC